MNEIKYDLYNEKLHIINLPNGLNVNLIVRPKFHQTFGILTTRYGSINNSFKASDSNEIKKYPNGIAHFLEHKLFEKEDHDAFDEFALYGADSNAFTSFTRTSYLFSTSSNVDKCVSTLLNFVQHPYFSEQTVEKEKGIIAQEIKMYEDDPNWQMLFGIIKNLYPNTPLTADIAGSVTSIQEITPQMLYECYDHFYQPNNMSLMLVGNFNLSKIKQIIIENQNNINEIKTSSAKNSLSSEQLNADVISYDEKRMHIQRPKLGIAVRGDCKLSIEQRLKYKVALQILLELLFGESSLDYQRLYDKGIIDNSFEYEIQLEEEFHFIYLTLNTNKVELASKEIKNILLNASKKLSQQKDIFEIMKKEFIGRYIKGMNSNENIADQFDKWLFGNKTLFDAPKMIEKLKLSDLLDLSKQLFKENNTTEFRIYPKE